MRGRALPRSFYARIVDDGFDLPAHPAVSTRVGLRAGQGDDHPWRWFLAEDPNISRGPRAR